jgi:DNA-directed RNA polymerase specialized sigma24 family protein
MAIARNPALDAMRSRRRELPDEEAAMAAVPPAASGETRP